MNLNARLRLLEENLMRMQKQMQEREKRIQEYEASIKKPMFKFLDWRKKS